MRISPRDGPKVVTSGLLNNLSSNYLVRPFGLILTQNTHFTLASALEERRRHMRKRGRSRSQAPISFSRILFISSDRFLTQKLLRRIQTLYTSYPVPIRGHHVA